MAATKSTFQEKLVEYKRKVNAYKNSFRRGGDDAIYGSYGFYTAGQEKQYLNRMVSWYIQTLVEWPAEAKSAVIETWWGEAIYFKDEEGTQELDKFSFARGERLTAWKKEHKEAIKSL